MNKDAEIFVAGAGGMVGRAIVRRLRQLGFSNLQTPGSRELDLRRESEVDEYFAARSIDYVFLAAARVGGIHANDTRPVDFLLDNLRIQNNVIENSHRHSVEKLMFLGSSCIYPKHARQPISESSLLTGPLEPTNEWYAIAKIAGIKLCQAFGRQYGMKSISVMPTNLYGPYDNFDLESSHVMPALMRKVHEAKISGQQTVEIWGTGKPLREFMHVDDLASACVFLMQELDEHELINVGSGQEISIGALAELIADIVGFEGEFVFNSEMPDGTPRKLMDSSALNAMNWSPVIGLEKGISETYEWALLHEFR